MPKFVSKPMRAVARFLFFLVAVNFLSLALAVPTFATPSFTALTPPETPLTIRGLSGDGGVLFIEQYEGGAEATAYVWTESSGFQAIAVPDGYDYVHARGISDDGQVLAVELAKEVWDAEEDWWVGDYDAARLTPDAGSPGSWVTTPASGLGTVRDDWILSGVSGDGQTLFGHFDNQAIRWTSGGGVEHLGSLVSPPRNSYALGSSFDGSIILGSSTNDASLAEAFLWDESVGTMMSLGVHPVFGNSLAVDASSDGSVVTGYSHQSGQFEAFIWTEASGLTPLGDLVDDGTVWSHALGISGDGSTIVGRVSGEGFIWTAELGMRGIQQALVDEYGLTEVAAWQNMYGVEAISADGTTISGVGRDADGVYRIWIATVPEPGTALLLGLGLVGLALKRKETE